MDPAYQLIVKYLLPDYTHSFSIDWQQVCFNKPRNFQELSNTELMQEIETLHKWMNGKGISSMEPGKFTENKEKLQNLMEEKDKHI